MTTQSAHALTLSILFGLLPACAMDMEDLGSGNYHNGINPEACDDYLCGTNTDALVTGYLTLPWLLDAEDPEPDAVHIVSMTRGGISYTPDLVDGALIGRHLSAPDLAGTNLVGAEFLLQTPTEQVRLRIDSVASETSWPEYHPRLYETYTMSYTNPDVGGSRWLDYCPNADPAYAVFGEFDEYGIKPSLVFRRMTLACRGDAVYKMRNMGYDVQEAAPGYQTTDAQRQATLNMITARYCPGSGAVTVPGTQYRFQNQAEWFVWEEGLEDAVVEAKWNHSGAVCLNDPRFLSRGTITQICGPLPYCIDDNQQPNIEWTSYLP